MAACERRRRPSGADRPKAADGQQARTESPAAVEPHYAQRLADEAQQTANLRNKLEFWLQLENCLTPVAELIRYMFHLKCLRI